MQSKDIPKYCKLDLIGEELLRMAITKVGLSARAYDRILKIARTIADLACSTNAHPERISEAIQYRRLDRDLRQAQLSNSFRHDIAPMILKQKNPALSILLIESRIVPCR